MPVARRSARAKLLRPLEGVGRLFSCCRRRREIASASSEIAMWRASGGADRAPHASTTQMVTRKDDQNRYGAGARLCRQQPRYAGFGDRLCEAFDRIRVCRRTRRAGRAPCRPPFDKSLAKNRKDVAASLAESLMRIESIRGLFREPRSPILKNRYPHKTQAAQRQHRGR